MQAHKSIVIATPDLSTGGLGSYLRTVAVGLMARGWRVNMLVTNTRGDLYDSFMRDLPCRDMSGVRLSVEKVGKAAEFVNSLAPDLLLLNNCTLLHYALPFIKTAVKPVAVLHSDDPRFYRTASLFERRIFRWIAPTPGVAQRLSENFRKELKHEIRMIPHGIESELFDGHNGKKSRSEKISFVGYLAKNKGADLLPEVMRNILVCRPDARLQIAGSGPLEGWLRTEFSSPEFAGKVALSGSISRRSVAGLLRDSDVLLLPTRIEGFGLAIAEAMTAGAVPVVSRLPGITDTIVEDRKTGILVEPDNVNLFSEAVTGLFKRPEELDSMSANAREAARSFSSVRMLDAYEAMFDEDDGRAGIAVKGKPGWFMETAMELVKKGIDAGWLYRRFRRSTE